MVKKSNKSKTKKEDAIKKSGKNKRVSNTNREKNKISNIALKKDSIDDNINITKKNVKKSGRKKNINKDNSSSRVRQSPPNKQKSSSNEVEKKIVKVIIKGTAAVDEKVENSNDYIVLNDNNKDWSATLNMSDLKNNNNKFYKIQILVAEKTNSFYIYNRWGRVGYDGQNSMDPCSDKSDAQRKYDKKIRDKLNKGYFEIEVDYNNEEKNEKEKDKKDKKTSDKKEEKQNSYIFDYSVKNLLELIFDMKLMNQQMKEIGYDSNKMTLGKIIQKMIKNGYDILCSIEAVIKGEKKGDLFELSSSFYTIIPHNFGFQ